MRALADILAEVQTTVADACRVSGRRADDV